MAEDPVTGVSNAVTVIGTVAETLINKYLSTEDQNDYTSYIQDYNTVCAENPPNLSDFNTYMLQLANRSGRAIGSLGGNERSCPVEYFDFLVERTNYTNLLVKAIAAMQYKQNAVTSDD